MGLVFPIFIEETVFFSIICSCLLYHIVIDHISKGLFLGYIFCSIDIYACFCASSILSDHCRFVVFLEIREHDTTSFVFLSQSCFGHSGLLWFPINLWLFALVLWKMPLVINYIFKRVISTQSSLFCIYFTICYY